MTGSNRSGNSFFHGKLRGIKPVAIKMKPGTENSPSQYQIGGVTVLARISDSLVNFSIVSFNVWHETGFSK